MIPVHIIGLGMSPEDLTPRMREIIQAAQVLVGGRRLLDYFSDHPGEKILLGKNPEETMEAVRLLADTRKVVVLASGDPNFYGIAPLAAKVWGSERVEIHPNVTAAQAACARLKMAWQDAALVSLHGRGWEALTAALPQARKLVIYTDPAHTPADIAGFLQERGFAEARVCVLENLGQTDERLTWLTPQEAAGRQFSPLNVVVVLKEVGSPPGLHLGLPEEALAHDAGMITKAEIRAVVLAKLRLLPGQTLWDVGAGSGSVGLEATLLLPGGRVCAVEENPERAAQMRLNRDRFGVTNLEVVSGQAPECLMGLPDPDRVFVGGGGQNLEDILTAALLRLKPGGRVVVTATLLETLELARAMLFRLAAEVEVVQLQVSRDRPLGPGAYLQALNPVWIISGAAPGKEN